MEFAVKISTRLLSFQQVADRLDVSLEVVRALVVEEKRLPALYVTLVGYADKYEYQLIDADPDGNACDLSELTLNQYQEGVRNQTGYLRVECDALEQFIEDECIDDSPSEEISSEEHPTMQAQTDETSDPSEDDDDEPAPLTTGDIAHCFAGLKNWDEKRWKKELGSPNKWLKACQHRPGTRGRGGIESTWFPIDIGDALVRKFGVKVNSVRGRFQSKALLEPWCEAWKTYEAENFDEV